LRQQPDALLYCFRGGLRSQTVQQWLAEAGVTRPRVAGGYKALRHFLIDTQAKASAECDWTVLTGMTGSGKTHMLAHMAQALDLEGHAHHRGRRLANCRRPAQQHRLRKRLAIELLKRRHRGEHSSWWKTRAVSSVAAPAQSTCYEAMSRAPLVVVEVPQEARAEQIRQDYVHDLWLRYQAMFGARCRLAAVCRLPHRCHWPGSSAGSAIRPIASWMP
jgi:tRNA 2-selenouridine synthase